MRRTILTAVAAAAMLLTGCGDGGDTVPAAAVDSVDEDGFTRGQRAEIVRLTGLRDYYAKKDDDDGPLTITEGIDEPEDCLVDVGTQGSQ